MLHREASPSDSTVSAQCGLNRWTAPVARYCSEPRVQSGLYDAKWLVMAITDTALTMQHVSVTLPKPITMGVSPGSAYVVHSVSNWNRESSVLPIGPRHEQQKFLVDLQALLIRGDYLRDVPDNPDNRAPAQEACDLAARLVLSLPDDIRLPDVSPPDEGELIFTWRTLGDDEDAWRGTLIVTPDLEVVGFVRQRFVQDPESFFTEKDGSELIELPDDFVQSLRAHW